MPHLLSAHQRRGASVWQLQKQQPVISQADLEAAPEKVLVYKVAIIADTCYVPKCFPCSNSSQPYIKAIVPFYRWKNWGLDLSNLRTWKMLSKQCTHGWISFIYFYLPLVFAAARFLAAGSSYLSCGAGFLPLWWLLLSQSTGFRRLGFSSCDTQV